MAIITKPVGGVLKGLPATFTLNKSQVLALSIVSNDEYFSDSNNWKKIILKYESSEGKQQELVRFDTTLASPTGFFFVSEKARDLFEIKSLKIVDFDGDILVIPRSALISSEFDIDFSESIPSSFLSVSSQNVNTVETAGWSVYGSGLYTFNDGANRIVQRLVNEPVRALGVIVIDGAATYPDGMEWVPTSITISGGNSSSSFTQIKTFTFVRSDFTADTLKYLVLDSDQSFEFYKITFNSYDKTYGGSFLFQGQISLHSAATAVQSVTWNVAGKTGVGTVTTGANGLITKNTGGSSYNVNVLSNETITGDGYVEFINSSIFVNVVFGLAEVNSSSGSFDNIIIGGYSTGAQGLEKVYNNGVTFSYGGGVSSIVAGDIVRFERVGTTYSIKINGTQVYSISNSSQNPLKASVTIYGETFGINNVTIAS
jgi:hypothetical protein